MTYIRSFHLIFKFNLVSLHLRVQEDRSRLENGTRLIQLTRNKNIYISFSNENFLGRSIYYVIRHEQLNSKNLK